MRATSGAGGAGSSVGVLSPRHGVGTRFGIGAGLGLGLRRRRGLRGLVVLVVAARARDHEGENGHEHGRDDQPDALVPRHAAPKYGNAVYAERRCRHGISAY